MIALTGPAGVPVTMTSLELVNFINSHRGADEAELRHDHFMAKVPKVLGDAAPNFLGTVQRPQPAGGFRDYPCYHFPKREACLMAMSYSYDLQAKVFDRWQELEAQAGIRRTRIDEDRGGAAACPAARMRALPKSPTAR